MAGTPAKGATAKGTGRRVPLSVLDGGRCFAPTRLSTSDWTDEQLIGKVRRLRGPRLAGVAGRSRDRYDEAGEEEPARLPAGGVRRALGSGMLGRDASSRCGRGRPRPGAPAA